MSKLFVLHCFIFISLLFITYISLWSLVTTADWVLNESRISKATWLNFYESIYQEVIWLMGSSYWVGFLQLENYSKNLNQIYLEQFWPHLSKNVIRNFLHCWMPIPLTDWRSLQFDWPNTIGKQKLSWTRLMKLN